MRLPRLLTPRTVVSAHCDLPCGVYDPAQARIEAESVKAICEKYQANTDPEFRTRARSSRSSAPSWSSTTSGCCGPTTSSRRTSRSTRTAPALQRGHQARRRQRRQGLGRPGQGRRAAGEDRRDRQDLLGDQAGVTTPSTTTIRPVRPSDVPAVVRDGARAGRVRARAPTQCHLTEAQLHAALFAAAPALFGHVGADADDRPVGVRAVVPELLHLGGRPRRLPGGPLRAPGRPRHRAGPGAARRAGRGLRRARLRPAGVVRCCTGTRPATSTPRSAHGPWTSGCRTGWPDRPCSHSPASLARSRIPAARP